MDFLGRETIEVCRVCGEVLARAYWRVDGDVVCSGCAADRRREAKAEARSCLGRGLLFGGVAAVIVAVLEAGAWVLIGQLELGADAWSMRMYLEVSVALAAGVMVGVAVRVGSKRHGGLSLQLTAAILTYLAYLGSVTMWSGSAVTAFVMMLLRAFVAPVMDVGRNAAGLPRLIDAVFGMGLAWQINREGKRVAISGPFGYASR